MPSSPSLLEFENAEAYIQSPYDISPRYYRLKERLGHVEHWGVLWGVGKSGPYAFLSQIADRLTESRYRAKSAEEEVRHYTLSVAEAFQTASKEYPSINVDSEVMAGAPCLHNTRIPVYMILDAIEYYGNVEAALRSYPSITLQQVKEAIGFAKLVVECPIEDNPTSPT